MNILQMTILELQEAMNQGTLTAHEITRFYLDRIARIDHGDPKYNSVFMVNPDALNIAKAMDFERKNGIVRSTMHGIPVLLKDNINTGDKQTTTGGARILQNHIAQNDATLVKQLRNQGAIILGKTNLTELACFKTFSGVNGYSSLAGYVLFPWNTLEDPSGSSTGSAVSMALRLAPVAIGTETGGSIMSPSMRNGVVGLKPTIGLVPRTGILPISSTLDTAGPMSSNVTNVAVLLSSMRSNDALDPVTLTKTEESVDYTKYLYTNHVKRIGFIKNQAFEKFLEEAIPFVDKTKTTLEKLGYEVVEVLEFDEVKLIYPIMKYEFKANLNAYLNQEGLALTLADFIKYNEANEKENLKYGQSILLEAEHQTSGKMIEQEYIDALQERIDATNRIQHLFDTHKLDLLYVFPYTSYGPECGFPTLSLPIGFDEKGYPIGTYFLAPFYHEGALLEVAYKLEQHLQLTVDPLAK